MKSSRRDDSFCNIGNPHLCLVSLQDLLSLAYRQDRAITLLFMLDANRKYLALLLRKILLRKQQGFVNYLAHAVKMTSFVSLERPPCLHYEHNSRVNINIPGTLTPISNKLMMKFFAPVFRSSNQIIVTPRKSWASHRSLNIWIIWSRFFWFMWITHCKSKHYYSYCRNS